MTEGFLQRWNCFVTRWRPRCSILIIEIRVCCLFVEKSWPQRLWVVHQSEPSSRRFHNRICRRGEHSPPPPLGHSHDQSLSPCSICDLLKASCCLHTVFWSPLCKSNLVFWWRINVCKGRGPWRHHHPVTVFIMSQDQANASWLFNLPYDLFLALLDSRLSHKWQLRMFGEVRA